MVESYSKESEMGRKRKYYRLTKKGLRLLEEKKEEWNLFASKVNKVLGGSGYALA